MTLDRIQKSSTGPTLGKFAVVYADLKDGGIAETGVYGVYDSAEDASHEMACAIRDMEAENEGYSETMFNTVSGRVYYNSKRTAGTEWRLVAV
ncbi:MAG: hypothetical protein HUJ63_01435 [Enterococcus sp.]|nr:hypothetical protein [Enterococcus sp.]